MMKPMKKEDLKEFKEHLLAKRKTLVGSRSHLKDDALKKSVKDAAGNIASVPDAFSEVGSDNYEQEFTLGLIEGEEEMLRAVDEALERIEKKTYGICGNCEKRIRKSRLRTIPFVRLCINCQELEEKGEILGDS